MADTPNAGANDDKPEGPPPAADPHLNGPGMTNGIPDANQADSAGSPSSDRSAAENAGK